MVSNPILDGFVFVDFCMFWVGGFSVFFNRSFFLLFLFLVKLCIKYFVKSFCGLHFADILTQIAT